MKLYSFWRSSAAFRVRLALALKGKTATIVPVDLMAGEHREDAFLAVNPQGAIPALVLEDGTVLTQSLAILDYLEERFPQPALLPPGARRRAQIRSLAQILAGDGHPLMFLRLQRYLEDPMGLPQTEREAFLHHFAAQSMGAAEAVLERHSREGAFCFGDAPGYADCVLVPHLRSCRGVGLDLAPYPRALAIEEAVLALPQVATALPEAQPDAPGN